MQCSIRRRRRLDYQAPHFAHSSGEFTGVNTCVARSPPKPAVVTDAGACPAHACDSEGVGAGAIRVLQTSGVEVVHSFHATRLAHIGHSGARWVNYSRWRHPDCHHVCSPSGAEELRTSLLVNMLLYSTSRGVAAAGANQSRTYPRPPPLQPQPRRQQLLQRPPGPKASQLASPAHSVSLHAASSHTAQNKASFDVPAGCAQRRTISSRRACFAALMNNRSDPQICLDPRRTCKPGG